MKIRSLLDGVELNVSLTTEHAASIYHQPVLVTGSGQAMGTFDVACCELVESSDEERRALVRAGYATLAWSHGQRCQP